MAAYLFSQGYQYLGTDKADPQNVAFCFSNSSKTMTEAISSFQIGKAEGNIMQFYLAYKRLLREAKS